MKTEWQLIETAPKDGSWFRGRRSYVDRLTGVRHYETKRTQWGKTSHVPLYGWCYVHRRGGDPDYSLWQPTHWKPLYEPLTAE